MTAPRLLKMIATETGEVLDQRTITDKTPEEISWLEKDMRSLVGDDTDVRFEDTLR